MMRFVLAAALLCASSALAQYEDDYNYDAELEARDARDSIWEAAHGGAPPNYHGFEGMADHYPGHPAKAFGKKHHARDFEEDDDEGFIDATASFANNVARAVKGAYQNVGSKAGEAVEHAKAKAGYEHDWRQFDQDGPAKYRGGSRNWARDVGDDDEEMTLDEFAAEEDGEFDMMDYDDPEADVQLAERDIQGEPNDTALGDDDEDVPDPKLQLEEEFDEGMDDEGLIERDAEPFWGFGGKHNDHEDFEHPEHEAFKKGMKHVFARDGGLAPEDAELDGAYDPISDDPSLTDGEFYAVDGNYEEEDEDELAKRAAPEAAGDDEDEDDSVAAKAHRGDIRPTGGPKTAPKSKSATKAPTKTKPKTKHTATKTAATKPAVTKTGQRGWDGQGWEDSPRGGSQGWGSWFGW